MLILTLNVSGCSFLKPEKEIPVVSCERQHLNLPPVPPLKLDDVNWLIVDLENSQSTFEQLKSRNIDTVLFSLTDEDYKNLSLNNLVVLQHVLKLNDQLNAYKQYYETENGQ